MTPLERVMEVQKMFPLREGWYCVDLSNTKVTMEHPEHGRRVCHVHRPGKIHVREVPTPWAGAPAQEAAQAGLRR